MVAPINVATSASSSSIQDSSQSQLISILSTPTLWPCFAEALNAQSETPIITGSYQSRTFNTVSLRSETISAQLIKCPRIGNLKSTWLTLRAVSKWFKVVIDGAPQPFELPMSHYPVTRSMRTQIADLVRGNRGRLGAELKVELGRARVFETIASLFGGVEAYNKLPILDVGQREGGGGYIDFITPAEMSAPIMRGTDKFGRRFFAIRFELRMLNNELHTSCHTFFERYTEGLDWADSSRGDSLITVGGYLIDQGIVKSKQFEELAAAIKNGRLGIMRIV